jgi:hypothetical protein
VHYPIPTHIKNLVLPDLTRSNEHELQGAAQCDCGSDAFQVLYVAERIIESDRHFLRVVKVDGHYFLRIGVRCISCTQEHLLLDRDFHGWNGFVCGNESARRIPRPPYQEWLCKRCGSTNHKAGIVIVGEDMEFAVGESEGVLSHADWFDAFGWFTLEVTCTSCGFGPAGIVDYETM